MKTQLKKETVEMIERYENNPERPSEGKGILSAMLDLMEKDYTEAQRVLNIMKKIDNDYLERG